MPPGSGIEAEPGAEEAHAAARSLYNHGYELWQQGKSDEAIRLYDAALAIRPDYPEALCAGGFILQAAGKHREALRFYDQALKYRPDFAIALANRGIVFMQLDAPDAAIASFTAALNSDPSDAATWTNLGGALNDLGRFVEALPLFEEALRLDPDLAQSFHNRGHAFLKLHRLQEALADFESALRLKPLYAAALCGKAVTLKELDQLEEAGVLFEQALALDPLSDHTRSNKAALLLLHGVFAEGWELYEYRWKSHNKPADRLRLPRLDYVDQLVAGQRVVVWDDQALGDIVQFSRFLPLLREAGANVSVLVRKSAHRLLASLGEDIEWIDTITSTESFAWQIALGSLPRAFRVDLNSLPAEVPYLAAEAPLVARWRASLGSHGFKIGVCWQGSSDARADIKRSFPIACLAAMAGIEGVRLISLQKGPAGDAASIEASGLAIEHLGDGFDAGADAFVDTAAVMQSLDLVVSCDTSVAHLAGALGVPVWVALKRVPEWRWLLHRSDTPWYPTMRLFRQPSRGDWETPFAAMLAELRTLLPVASASVVPVASASAEPVASASAEPVASAPIDSVASAPVDKAVHLPCSVGELIDKMTILAIKLERIEDAGKRLNVFRELELLRAVRRREGLFDPRLLAIETRLADVNAALWEIEDAIRLCERGANFGARFIELARSVYATNDRRAELKREINQLFGSAIIEEKSYAA